MVFFPIIEVILLKRFNFLDANSNFYNTKTRFFHIFYYTPFQTVPLAGRFIKASSCLYYNLIWPIIPIGRGRGLKILLVWIRIPHGLPN